MDFDMCMCAYCCKLVVCSTLCVFEFLLYALNGIFVFREVLDRLVHRAHEDWLDKKELKEKLYVFVWRIFLTLFVSNVTCVGFC